MATYLAKFVERAHGIPAETQRFLALIRDLDEKVVCLKSEVDTRISELSKEGVVGQEEASPPTREEPGRVVLPQDVEEKVNKAMRLAEEKIKVAGQLYDYIDEHIQELDKELSAFEEDLVHDRKDLTLNDYETACTVLGIPLPAEELAKMQKPPSRKRKAEELQVDTVAKQPVEEAGVDEPKYCLCNGISSGNMVACDNPDCAIEWFHFECVGLVQVPKSKWYCPMCAPLMKRGRKG